MFKIRIEYAIKPLIFKIRLYELVPRSIEHMFSNMPRDTWLQAAVVLSADWSIDLSCACAWWRKTKWCTLTESQLSAQTTCVCDSDAQTVTHPFLPCTGCHCKKPKYSSRTTSRSEQTSHTYVACTVMNLESWTQATMVSEARLLGFSIPFCFSVRWAWRRSNRRNILFRQSKKC